MLERKAAMGFFKGFGTFVVFLLVALVLNVPSLSSPATPIPKHILTWAYDGGDGGMTDGTTPVSTNPTSKHHVQTWVSFAEAGNASNRPQKAFYDCGYSGAPCKFVIYYDPVTLFSDCDPDVEFLSENTSEDYYLHDSAPASQSNRTTRTLNGCRGPATVYFPNLTNPAVGQWFARHELWTIPENSNTVMMQDVSDADCRSKFHPGQTYTPYELQGTPSCEASLTKALRTTAEQMRWKDGTPVPVIVNGLAGINQYEKAHVRSVPLLRPGSNIIGGISEAHDVARTNYRPLGTYGNVNTASLVYAENQDALFVYLGTPRAPVGSEQACTDAANNVETNCGQLQLRRLMLAAFWLAYKEDHEVIFEATVPHANNNPGLRLLTIYPEMSIYPSEPLKALRPFDVNLPSTDGSGCGPEPGSGGIQTFVVSCGTLNDGKTPAGVYVREFRRCYNFGDLIGSGQCAVVMNTTDGAITIGQWFSQDYTNKMVWGTGPRDGADVLTAGCDDSKCPTSAIDPLGAPFKVGQTRVPAFDAAFLFHE
jgi:hypothetical protein